MSDHQKKQNVATEMIISHKSVVFDSENDSKHTHTHGHTHTDCRYTQWANQIFNSYPTLSMIMCPSSFFAIFFSLRSFSFARFDCFFYIIILCRDNVVKGSNGEKEKDKTATRFWDTSFSLCVCVLFRIVIRIRPDYIVMVSHWYHAQLCHWYRLLIIPSIPWKFKSNPLVHRNISHVVFLVSILFFFCYFTRTTEERKTFICRLGID